MKQSERRYAAFTVFEVAIATAVISAVLILAIQMLVFVSRRMEISQQHLLASQAAASLLERIAAQPYEKIEPELLTSEPLQSTMQELAPNWTTNLSVTESNDGLPTKRIEVTLTRHADTPRSRSIHLTTWRFAAGAVR